MAKRSTMPVSSCSLRPTTHASSVGLGTRNKTAPLALNQQRAWPCPGRHEGTRFAWRAASCSCTLPQSRSAHHAHVRLGSVLHTRRACSLARMVRTMTATSASASCGLAAGLSLWGSSFASALAWWAITRTASASSQHAQPGAMPARRQAHAPAKASRQLKAHAYYCPGGRRVAAAVVVSATVIFSSGSSGSQTEEYREYRRPASKARSRRGLSAALLGARPEMRLTAAAKPPRRRQGRMMLGSSLLGQRLGFDSRCCAEMQCRAGPCLREGGGARCTRPNAPAQPTLRSTLDCHKHTAAAGGAGFFVLAKQVSRKERTQKRHKTIRSKVSE